MDLRVDIEDLKKGDETAFRLLFEAYRDKVYNTLLGFTGSAVEAEDLAQDVFVQVHQSLRQFRGDSSLSTWIYRIAVNTALMHRRSLQRKQNWARAVDWVTFSKQSAAVRDISEHPGVQLERKEKADQLYAALQKLPENQRTAWTLHKVEDLSYEEIAGVMSTSVSSVESLMFRAKQNLQKHLHAYYRNA